MIQERGRSMALASSSSLAATASLKRIEVTFAMRTLSLLGPQPGRNVVASTIADYTCPHQGSGRAGDGEGGLEVVAAEQRIGNGEAHLLDERVHLGEVLGALLGVAPPL